jgi:hypothetical protein
MARARNAVAVVNLGSPCSKGPVHEKRAGPEHAHATRPHAIRTTAGTQRRHGGSTPEHAHATRPHATREPRRTKLSRWAHHRGGSQGGSPAAPPRCRKQSPQSPANMSQQLISSTMVGSGEPGAMHPARRQRSAVQTGTRFVSLRENKQCPVSLKQLNQYSGEGARPRGPHPHTAKKGPCGPAKRVEREGPKRRGPDGTEQGLSPAGEKHLRPSECRFGTSAAACGREAAALAARDDASVGGGSRGRRLASPVCAGGAPQCSVGAAAEKEGRMPRPPQSASVPRRSAACSRSREPRLARRAAIVEST